MATNPTTAKTIGQLSNLTDNNGKWSIHPTIYYQLDGLDNAANSARTKEMVRDVFDYFSTLISNKTFLEGNSSRSWRHLFTTNRFYDALPSFGDGISFGNSDPNRAFAKRTGSSRWDSLKDRAHINLGDNFLKNNPSFTWDTIVHEIAHALGLSHPGPYNGSGVTWASHARTWNDTQLLSTMSYFSPNNGNSDLGSHEHPSIKGDHLYNKTIMPVDYYALRNLYGDVTREDHSGNTVLGRNTNISRDDETWRNFSSDILAHRFFYTDPGNHNETLDVSNFSNDQTIDLRPTTSDMKDAHWSSIGGKTKNLAFSERSLFEKAVSGSGSDQIYGNNQNNVLIGNGGNDWILGFAGDDIISGGHGKDVLSGGDGLDVFKYSEASESFHGAHRRDYIDQFKANGTSMDKVDLSEMNSRHGIRLRYIGRAEFSGASGQVRFSSNILQVDTNGDSIAEMQVQLGISSGYFGSRNLILA